TRLDKLEAARPATGDPKALAALDGRVKTLETRNVDAPDLSNLTGRVTSLEGSLKSLAKTAEEGGSVAQGAALDAKVNDMEQRLQGSVASVLDAQKAETTAGLEAVQGEVAALKAKLGALAEANLDNEADLGPELTGIDQRLAELEGILPALSTAIDRSAASARSGAFAIAFANLRDAVGAGRPFAAELAAVQTLLPETQDLGDLAAHAGAGIPTVPELAQKLQTLAQASLTPPPPGGSESFVDSVIASAKSAISVRRIDAAAESGEPGDVLTRAEAALKQGDLAAAMKEVETLPAPSRDAFTGWLDEARARIAANETLGKLESTVLLSLSGADGAAEKP
ncbi:MAG: mitofilin family membrane protein, partial [Methyloceanibacter sp.]